MSLSANQIREPAPQTRRHITCRQIMDCVVTPYVCADLSATSISSNDVPIASEQTIAGLHAAMLSGNLTCSKLVNVSRHCK